MVNSFNNIVRRRTVQLFATILFACGAFFFLAAFITDRSADELISKRVNIAVRAIGHELLLRAGDTTSVVRPVIEKSTGVFLLQFENEFVFQPDTLVVIVQRLLARTELSQYTVTVQKCHRPEIVYGFVINPPQNSIEPCLGRTQSKACYDIEIAFADFPHPKRMNSEVIVMVSAVLSVLAFVLISRNLVSEKSNPIARQKVSGQNEDSAACTIGKFAFDTTHQHLRIGDQTIPLTEKECRILMLLNTNIGRLTLRDELIQDVWTDEGVITGRSLDMFISKLRKKLKADPDLRITNVHGRGYRLEIVK